MFIKKDLLMMANVMFSFKLNLIFLSLFLCFLSSCSIPRDLKHKSQYTPTEIKKIKKCNTAKFSWYMGSKSKRIILLTNLLRLEPVLLKKHYALQTDSLYYNDVVFNSRINRNNKNRDLKLVKPSFNLTLASKIHSIHSGIVGQTGHQNLSFRMIVTLNFNFIYGENCTYGYKDPYSAMESWIKSSGHYQSLINNNYYRIGVSKFWHRYYGTNYVQVFSGKKWKDHIFKK